MSTPDPDREADPERADADGADPVAELEATHERVTAARERVEQIGESDLERLRKAYESFVDLLDRYEPQVTGDEGDFQTIVEFQSQLDATMNRIHEDVLHFETFEEADERLQQRYFKTSDFDAVREQLVPVADLVERLEEHERALDAYRKRRREIERTIRELGREIDELDRLVRLGEADLTASSEQLREPIAAYNDAVGAAFAEYRRQTPAREVLAWLSATRQYPLVGYEPPPESLRAYVTERPVGTEPIPTLLEYAEYSRGKLEHYVDDPGRFENAVAGQKTYLAGLDAEPLEIDWPPPSAGLLEYRCRELTAVLNRFAPTVVERLRTVAAFPRETDYDRLRESVLVETELTAEERERIATEDLASELTAARETRRRLRAALDEFPVL